VIELFGDGKQKRDLVHVDDVVEALLQTGASEAADGQIYNLGGQQPISLLEIARELIKLTGKGSVESATFPPERRLIDIGNFYASYQKIESALGWRPRTPLREGLAHTIEFYRKNRQYYWDPHAYTLPRSEATATGD